MNDLLRELLQELAGIRRIMLENQAATAKRDAVMEEFLATVALAIATKAIPTVDQQRRPGRAE